MNPIATHLLDRWPALVLLVLALLSGIVYLRRHSQRSGIAFAARVLALVCVALALAEPRLAVPHDHTTVLFVLDRSLSVPEDLGPDGKDRRWERIRKFLNDSVRYRPASRKRDQVGLIVF